jgi:long-chain acyl-CoA synthetase
MAVHQLIARGAQVRPEGIALAHGDHQVTWARFADRVGRRASQLRSKGLEPGDRVAVIAANVPEHLELHGAVLWAGLVLVPLNTRLTAAEQIQILRHADCRLLCHDSRNASRGRYLAGELQIAVSSLDAIDTWGTQDDPLTDQAPREPRNSAFGDVTAIFYTGGTTGVPKGVVLSHGSLWLQALSLMNEFGYTEETVYLHTAPLFHLADVTASLGATAAAGRHVFLSEFSPDGVIDAIERHGANVVTLAPTMISVLLDAAGPRLETLRRLRTILYGTAPIHEAVLRRLLQALPNAKLFQVYGQTEIGGGCTVLRPELHTVERANPGVLSSVGRVTAAFQLKIVDDRGQAAPIDTVGEVCIGGPGVMLGYWKEPTLTASTLRNGWVHSGDLGRLDSRGFLTIIGRIKDMIITGGENVFAGEVENVLMQHPHVASAAVLGVPDAKWGEAVYAVVVPKDGRMVSAAELITHCKAQIAGFKCPRQVQVRHTPLPLSGVGKVRKVELREEWLRAHSA